MPQPPTIELASVSYRAAERLILRQASWQLCRGEHWAIVGPNGSGKTTLLKIACGYLWPNAGGEVRRQGRVLLDLRELRRSIGWVTYSLSREIPPRQRVLETVVAGRFAQTALVELRSDPPLADDYTQAEHYLADSGCEHLLEQSFGSLSQGEQQKVLIARARMARPLLIVLDEPCAGLDPAAREQFLADLERLAQQQRALSLVLVTHHIEEIMPSFDHLLIMHQGRITHPGTTVAGIDEKLIERVYGIRPSELIHRRGRIWPVW